MAGRPLRRARENVGIYSARRNPSAQEGEVWLRPLSDVSRGRPVAGSRFEYVLLKPDSYGGLMVISPGAPSDAPVASFDDRESAEYALEESRFYRGGWETHKYGQYFAGPKDTRRRMSVSDLEKRGAVIVPATSF